MTAHYPLRHTWTCTGCGDNWPCAIRRQDLAREYSDVPTSLVLLMAAAFVEGCG